jgi:hypothetical protein
MAIRVEKVQAALAYLKQHNIHYRDVHIARHDDPIWQEPYYKAGKVVSEDLEIIYEDDSPPSKLEKAQAEALAGQERASAQIDDGGAVPSVSEVDEGAGSDADGQASDADGPASDAESDCSMFDLNADSSVSPPAPDDANSDSAEACSVVSLDGIMSAGISFFPTPTDLVQKPDEQVLMDAMCGAGGPDDAGSGVVVGGEAGSVVGDDDLSSAHAGAGGGGQQPWAAAEALATSEYFELLNQSLRLELKTVLTLDSVETITSHDGDYYRLRFPVNMCMDKSLLRGYDALALDDDVEFPNWDDSSIGWAMDGTDTITGVVARVSSGDPETFFDRGVHALADALAFPKTFNLWSRRSLIRRTLGDFFVDGNQHKLRFPGFFFHWSDLEGFYSLAAEMSFVQFDIEFDIECDAIVGVGSGVDAIVGGVGSGNDAIVGVSACLPSDDVDIVNAFVERGLLVMCELMQFVQDNKDAGKDIGYRLPLGGAAADATMGDVGDEYAPGVGDGLDHGVDLNACWEVTVADAEPVPSTPTARTGGRSKHAASTKAHMLQPRASGGQFPDAPRVPYPTTGKQPMSDLSTPCILGKCFPHLFPTGRGDPSFVFGMKREERAALPKHHCVPMDEWIRHLMRYQDRRFAEDSRFVFWWLNYYLKSKTLDAADWTLKQDVCLSALFRLFILFLFIFSCVSAASFHVCEYWFLLEQPALLEYTYAEVVEKLRNSETREEFIKSVTRNTVKVKGSPRFWKNQTKVR